MERALRQELRAADLLGLGFEYVDEQRADRLALFSGSVVPASALQRHGGVPTYVKSRHAATGHVGLQKALSPPAKLPSWTLGKGYPECPGDVAVPEIAFASRRCNKTGPNQQ
jgi:hypothetical protein